MSDGLAKTSTLNRSATLGRLQPVRLLVIDGPDRGKSAVVEEGTALVGREPSCALSLSDPAVSRRHLSLELLGAKVRLKDLGSNNGVRYLGARVDGIELALGAVIELGGTQLAILPATASAALSERDELPGLLGRSVAMRRLFGVIEQVASTDAAVLIHGETGSGKEGVARALHALSPRSGGPFQVFDCGSVSRELLQSALFGHVKGAFTSAVKDTAGALELADQGVLFLDEVGELPLDLQPSLLRALETHSFTRVGDGKARKSDFRLLAATHVDLESKVAQGKFRADLYYRLAAIVLEVPPLAARREDVPLLAHRFAASAGATTPLTPTVLAALAARQWPGNVRELKNVVERIVAMGPQAVFPELPAQADGGDFHQAREQALRAFERSYLEALLERHGQNASQAAREAGIARSYLYKLLEVHGLKR
ncbi:MAG: sigma 54-interacting transcriptional regulator [Myxococcaceae bacterium]|nr:sigma 54-interacting transcriptional regulator [Myxococcaceae bacterium]